MDMNVLNLYRAEQNGNTQPDLIDLEDILKMEGLIGEDGSLKTEEPQQLDLTSNNEDQGLVKKENEQELKNEQEQESKQENEQENDEQKNSVDNETENDINKDEESENSYVDIDDIIRKIESEDINLDLVKQLEQYKIDMEELKTKYDVLKNKYEKLLEEKAALESGEPLSEIPAKVKGFVKLVEKYDNGDESVKEGLIDYLAGMLTDLTGKDIYSIIGKPQADVADLSEIEQMAGGSASSASGKQSKQELAEGEDIDPEALKMFGIEFY